jgi:hypothetical protein
MNRRRTRPLRTVKDAACSNVMHSSEQKRIDSWDFTRGVFLQEALKQAGDFNVPEAGNSAGEILHLVG